jgi:hypothetical protein
LKDGLDERITAVSSSLREAVAPIVDELVGPSHRAAALARRLRIDKSLCGRVLRSIKASDPFEVIHEAPAPYGLRIFLGAAADAGIGPALRGRAEESITQFESLIQAFPDGRAALEAAISDYIPEVRSRNERAAKQAVYKSMSYLLGYQAEESLHTAILSPADDGWTVDSLHVSGLYKLRRLRGQAPINLFGIRNYETQPGAANWMETIDGKRSVTDASEYLLADYCDHPLPDLMVLQEGDLLHTALSASSLPLNTPITLMNGWISRGASLRYRSEKRTHEWHAALTRIPARLRIQDYFIHEDVFPGVIPEVQARMHGLVVDRVRRTGEGERLDEIAVSTPVMSLGMGLEAPELRNPAMPRYRAMLREVFDRAGRDPARFRAYRCSVVYPVPFVSLTAWFRLPEAPAGARPG